MKKLATVDERYQSYNIEMVEVTGGRFWRPMDAKSFDLLEDAKKRNTSNAQQVGMDPALFEYRAPIDLSNPKLRKLAAALGPVYVRVSGSWANMSFFQDTDAPAPAKAPDGFSGVLTRQQWKGVIDFTKAVDGRLVTNMPATSGTRDAKGDWTAELSEKWIAYTKSVGGSIAAAEFINEPTFPAASGVMGYNGERFARDVKTWKAMMKRVSPETELLGPGGIGEGSPIGKMAGPQFLPTERLLEKTGDAWDAFSYHAYPTVSRRCAAGTPLQASPAQGMSEEFLKRTDTAYDAYAELRDKYMPGKAMWLTETGQAACGGDLYAHTFADSFRYLYQLGTLAQRGVQTVMHNTLSASDYGLLDEKTYEPRANYWAAIMWHKLMGTTVLDAGNAAQRDAYVFAQCTKGRDDAVSVLADNAGDTPLKLSLPAGEAYLLSATSTDSQTVMLNGKPLTISASGEIPAITGKKSRAGEITVQPKTILFYVTTADNVACKLRK
jgi:heparanase 1